MVHAALKVAEELEKEGISLEVVDLRTVQPLDIETIIASVENRSRSCSSRSSKQAGIATNVVAEINDRAILNLEAPVVRVVLIQYSHSLKQRAYGYQTTKILLKL